MMQNRLYYANILSNKIAYLPFWKENKSKNSYFIKDNYENWSYVDRKEDKYALTRLRKLSLMDKFLYFGNDILVIALMSILIFLSFSKSTMLLLSYWAFFGCVIVLSYILIFSMKRPKLANMIMFISCIITALMILKSYGVSVLYNNLVILCAIYVIFAFSLTSIIIKNIIVKDTETNLDNPRVNFFKLNNKDGILLVAHRSEKLSDEEVKELLEKQERVSIKEQKSTKKTNKQKNKEKEIEDDDDEYYDE